MSFYFVPRSVAYYLDNAFEEVDVSPIAPKQSSFIKTATSVKVCSPDCKKIRTVVDLTFNVNLGF
jgi:hypothetical protein